jgi:Rad3-related DNA helicase
MVHQPDNFQERLNYFLNDSEPDTVFISPTCYQGIDLKGDRGRFQIIIRVPYPNISDVFIKDMLDRSPLMFSYLALVTFGQQTGRVMRSPTDWGKTYLIDSRFSDVISQHRKWLSNNILPRLQKV